MKHPIPPPTFMLYGEHLHSQRKPSFFFLCRDPSPMNTVGVRKLHTGTLCSPHPSRCGLRSPMEANGDPIHVSEISRQRSWGGGGGDARRSTRTIFFFIIILFFLSSRHASRSSYNNGGDANDEERWVRGEKKPPSHHHYNPAPITIPVHLSSAAAPSIATLATYLQIACLSGGRQKTRRTVSRCATAIPTFCSASFFSFSPPSVFSLLGSFAD